MPIPRPLKTLPTPWVNPLDRSEYMSLTMIEDVVNIPPPPMPAIYEAIIFSKLKEPNRFLDAQISQQLAQACCGKAHREACL